MAQKSGDTVLATHYIIQAVAGEALAIRDAVYIDAADGKAYKTDADVSTKTNFVGFAQAAYSSGATANIKHEGHLDGFSGLTIGGEVWLSTTAGAVTQTQPTNAYSIGFATSASVIKLAKSILIQSFTSSGTWIKPAFAKAVEVIAIGGGSGGEGGVSGGNPGSGGAGGSGGGGGAYSTWIFPAVGLGSTETVTVGQGGAAGTGGVGISQLGTQNSGTNSTFGSHLTAAGANLNIGGVGLTLTGGAGGLSNTNAAAVAFWAPTGGGGGGSGGSGAGIGNTGANGGSQTQGTIAGGAGGAGGNPAGTGTGGNGTAGTSTTALSGKGGTGGGGGGGGGGNSAGTKLGGNGANGGTYGAGGGGGGGGGNSQGTGGNGGTGANGIVIAITYF